MFRIYFTLGILALIVGLSATSYIYYLKYQNVGQKYEQVLEVNKANTRAAKELREDWQVEKRETEKELAAAQSRATAIEEIKQELQNAPNANDPAGPFFDELAKRLQSIDSGTAN